ncbi:hypothetical protein DL766_005325 [Monosporascus sp. MC13-8B]|nr:hypothetical protein DL763_003743 [Monosporascus cannonballus]RYP29521.1 hypothetical protein DL766_005325 [Monosporascus sp. MC13-8B]
MQRRNSTRSSKSLDRRKSTSSAKSVHLEHIPPETAERDAQAAATRAFARARDRSTMGTSLWLSPRSNGRPSSSNGYAARECVNVEPELRRQQSVRFVQPRPPPMKKASTVTGDVTPTRGIGPGSIHATETAVDSRFKCSAFTSGMASAARGTAGDYITALITSEEYYTPEDDIASVPSSYRRIRKSRSMYSSSEPSAVAEIQSDRHFAAMTNGFPSSGGNMASLTNENKPPSRLKAPKSMSFLRNRRDQYAAFPISQYSMSCRSKPTGDKAFKKSLRDVGNAPQSTSLKAPRDGGLRDRARKVSQGFKHKLKNLLNLNKGDNTDSMAFPPQQIEASTTHNAEIERSANRIDDTFLAEPPTDEGALSHVTSGVPSLHTVPSCQQLRSRQGSLESLRSERKVSDERSRATSWSNSDVSAVTSTNSLKRDWERQRLPVIKENGTHVSSSSARRAPALDHSIQPNISVIPLQQPMPNQVTTVNGQRIYSALMKRVNGKQKQPQNIDLQRKRSIEGPRRTGTIQPRGSSYNHEDRELEIPTTIRQVVVNDSDHESVRTAETVITTSRPKTRDEPGETCTGTGNTQENEAVPPSTTTTSTDMAHGTEHKYGRLLAGPDTGGKHLVRDSSGRKSALFGSPACHLFRTTSPYRRALQESMKAAADSSQPKSPEFNPSMQSLTNIPMRCPSTCDSEVDKKMQYAKSIYSCTSEEPKNSSCNSISTGGGFPKPPKTDGEAAVFVDPPVYRPAPPVPPRNRIVSSTSSVEWKTWLSANASKLEGSSGRWEREGLHYKLPSMPLPSRHIRERTQITDEVEDGDGNGQLDVYQPTRPDTMVASTEHSSKRSAYLPHPTTKVKVEPSSSDKENEEPQPPPIPPRSGLRITPSLVSVESGSGQFQAPMGPSTSAPVNPKPHKSLAHVQSLNPPGGSQVRESGRFISRLPRREPRAMNQSGTTPSPGIAAAVDKQFGMLGHAAITRRKAILVTPIKSENVSPRTGPGGDQYGEGGSDIIRPEPGRDPPETGGKKMVDMFLSSRRRRMASSEDGSVFL